MKISSVVPLLFAVCCLGSATAGTSELAPAAGELQTGEARLTVLLGAAHATGRATGRLQAVWTALPVPKSACDDAGRLALAWRIERFGAAWREASQAARAEAARVQQMRTAATVAPLVSARWSNALDVLLAEAERDGRAVVEASAWQVRYVRPTIAACPVVSAAPAAGIPMLEVPVAGEPRSTVAVLALGEGWVCPGSLRAEESVVLVPGEACWSASPSCVCKPAPVEPGAVLGPPASP